MHVYKHCFAGGGGGSEALWMVSTEQGLHQKEMLILWCSLFLSTHEYVFVETYNNMMAWQWAETLVDIRGTLADIRGTTK